MQTRACACAASQLCREGSDWGFPCGMALALHSRQPIRSRLHLAKLQHIAVYQQ